MKNPSAWAKAHAPADVRRSRRPLALLLSLVLCLSLLSAAALAADPVTTYDISVVDQNGDAVTITSANCNDVLGDGTVSYRQETQNGETKGILTLNGAQLCSDSEIPIDAPDLALEIELLGQNTVQTEAVCITADTLIFSGTGKLNVSNDFLYAIDCTGSVTVNGGEITVNAVETALCLDGALTVNDGTLLLTASDEYGMALDAGWSDPQVVLGTDRIMLTGTAADGSDAVVTATSDTDIIKAAKYIKIFSQNVPLTFRPGADGEGDETTQNKLYGIDFALPGALFTRAGYTQTGWAAADGGDKLYDLGQTYTDNTPLTLYPVWTAAPSSGSSGARNAIVIVDAAHGTITASAKTARAGDVVTITVTPDAGYVLGDLFATDKNNRDLPRTDIGGGRYTFVMPDSRVTIEALFTKNGGYFRDVPERAYYYNAVQWAVDSGITTGVSSDLFAPEQSCTRAQIVTFLWRAAGSPAPKALTSFSDVAANSYYAKAVAWAVENGITEGTGGGKFSPDAPCTRAQAVTFLYRAQNAKASAKAAFSDVPADSYYAEAVAWAAETGVTEGTGNGKFSPNTPCTRAQIVTFLYRALA